MSIDGLSLVKLAHDLLSREHRQPIDPKAVYRTRDVALFEEAAKAIESLVRARPEHEWTEEDGDVLWWHFPVCEPPWVGSPLGSDWDTWYTHWTPIVTPPEYQP